MAFASRIGHPSDRAFAQSQFDSDPRPLESGSAIEQTLDGGQSHSYQITLRMGQYLRVMIDQLGIAIVVMLFRPDGKPVIEVDSPNGTRHGDR